MFHMKNNFQIKTKFSILTYKYVSKFLITYTNFILKDFLKFKFLN